MESSDETRERYERANAQINEMARAMRRKMGVDENDPFAMTNKMIEEMESAGPEWTGSECLKQILEINLKIKESLEADKKRKRYHSPAEGMTKAEIWECSTGEKLTEEQVIDAINEKLGKHPTLSKHWEVLTGEKLTDEEVRAKIEDSYWFPRDRQAQA